MQHEQEEEEEEEKRKDRYATRSICETPLSVSLFLSRPICRTNVDAIAMMKRCHRTDEDINLWKSEREKEIEREREREGKKERKEGTAITRVTRVTDN